MICSISCRYSSEGHSLASHWRFRQLHSPFFCERNGFEEARFSSHRKVGEQNWKFQGFGSGLRSWKLVGHQRFRDVRFGFRTASVLDAWPAYELEKNSCTLSTRKSRSAKIRTMAGSKCGMNAAMEVCYGTDSSKADKVDKLENLKNQANATALLPGINCTTVGKSTNIAWQECMVKKEERQKLLGQKGCVIWITGLSGSGKSTLACTLDHALLKRGNLSYIIDGDNVRHGLNNNLGFCAEDRSENIRRVGEVAKLFADAGLICIASLISPYRKDRDACRQLLHAGEFIEVAAAFESTNRVCFFASNDFPEVHMNFPLTLCEERDPKGLYKLARAGKIKGFTGVDDPYEAPVNCEVVLQPVNGRCPTPAELASQLILFLEERQILGPPR